MSAPIRRTDDVSGLEQPVSAQAAEKQRHQHALQACEQLVLGFFATHPDAFDPSSATDRTAVFHQSLRLLCHHLFLLYAQQRGLSPTFSPPDQPLLDDAHLSRAIAHLAAGLQPLNRSVPPVRQLGEIYEMLLGYRLVYDSQTKELRLTQDPTARKKSGSFYTPQPVVDYIIEKTLAPLIEQARRQTAVSFPQAILRLRLLDPAMGAGYFLLSALRHLAQALLDDEQGKDQETKGTAARRSVWKRRVLENCLFGVDKNPLTVELAQRSLWLETAVSNAPLPLHNLRHADSLFPKKPDSSPARFDAIIGNPPYGDLLTQEQKTVLRQRGFQAGGSGNNDVFRFFVELGLKQLRPQGRLGFIIPNSALGGSKYGRYRQLVSQKATLLEIVDFKTAKLFAEEVFTHILLLSAQPTAMPYYAVYRAGSVTASTTRPLTVTPGSAAAWLPTNPLITRLRHDNRCVPLADIGEIADAGINYQRHNVGWQNREKSQIAAKIFYEGEQKAAEDYRYLKGEDVERFAIVPKVKRWLIADYADVVAANETVSVNHEWAQQQPKILTRQTADSIIAAVDNDGYYTGRSLHSTQISQPHYAAHYLTAVLNSRLVNHLYQSLAQEKGRPLAQVKLSTLRRLPVPNISFTTPAATRTAVGQAAKAHYRSGDAAALQAWLAAEDQANRRDTLHDLLTFLAQQMTTLSRQRKTENGRFWLTLERQLVDSHLFERLKKGKWERSVHRAVPAAHPFVAAQSRRRVTLCDALGWSEAAYLGFVGLLVKGKANGRFVLPYRKHAPAVQQLTQQLTTTNALIDAIVYQLYSLTDEEIATVKD